MPTMPQSFAELQQTLDTKGVSELLTNLAARLRDEKKYHELFEALKMQVRLGLGLPLLYSDLGDELPLATRNKLEEGLLRACSEVGILLLKEGRIREGWMYLRPVGDRGAAARELTQVEPDDDNLDELVEVLLHEGVDTKRGFELVLNHYGTCNAITTFEGVVARHPRADQQKAAGLLVEHVHRELFQSVKTDIERQEGGEPAGSSLRELVADRPWLFSDFSYHIDTTHLAATVRFARMLDDERQLRLALDLTEYGRRLSAQFQYKSEEPFVDIYPSHALFFHALLGEDVPAAVAYFRERAEQVSVPEQGTAAVEVYVHLLRRSGRPAEAVAALLQLVPHESRPGGYNTLLLECSQEARDFGPFLDYCREHGDLLGYATGLAVAKGQ